MLPATQCLEGAYLECRPRLRSRGALFILKGIELKLKLFGCFESVALAKAIGTAITSLLGKVDALYVGRSSPSFQPAGISVPESLRQRIASAQAFLCVLHGTCIHLPGFVIAPKKLIGGCQPERDDDHVGIMPAKHLFAQHKQTLENGHGFFEVIKSTINFA